MKQDTILGKVIIGLLLLTIVCYLVLSGVKSMSNPHKMVMVYSDVVEDSISLGSWVFREETRLGSADGLVSYQLDEGEKAASGQVAAISYRSQEALLKQEQLRALERQKEQAVYATADDTLEGSNLETQIKDSLVDIQTSAARGDFSRLSRQSDLNKKLILRRENISSDAAAGELGMAVLSLDAQLKEMKDQVGQDAEIIYTTASGIFSSYVDGYEAMFQPSKLTDITPKDLRALVSQTPQSNDGAVGKVATATAWYMALIVQEKDIPLFQQNGAPSVRLASLSEAVPVSVEQIGYVQEGEAVVVLRSKKNLADIINLREQTVSVVFRSEEGIRIPKNALRVRDDGVAGVYTVAAFSAEFKPVNIVDDDKDDYIVVPNLEVKDSKKDKRVLRSGDEVILTTAELYEGKVVR